MKNKLILSCSILGFAILASSVFGESIQGGKETPTRFTVVFADHMTSDSRKARGFSLAKRADLARVREQLSADKGLATRLRARGIQLRNILRIEPALNGAKIVYAR